MRPLTGEPLPLDLLNTTWMSGGERQDLLTTDAGAREWLDEHGFVDAPAGTHALIDAREAMRAVLLDRSAIDGVNAVLARGARRPRLTADAVTDEFDVAPEWRIPWLREPRLHPLVPRHDTARNAPLVLDGRVRQPRQGDSPRPDTTRA